MAAVVNVGATEKMEPTSVETQLKIGWLSVDVTDEEEEGAEGAATLTKPLKRLRRDSGHKLPLDAEDGSKVKRPLYARGGMRGVSGGRFCRSASSDRRSET